MYGADLDDGHQSLSLCLPAEEAVMSSVHQNTVVQRTETHARPEVMLL